MASRVSEAVKAKIRKLQEEGLSYREIADKVDRSLRGVYLVCNPKARERDRISNRKYHAEHREEELINHRKYNAEHREEMAAYDRKYYAKKRLDPKFREKRKAYLREYWAEHREERLQYNREHREERLQRYIDNREKVLAQCKKYRHTEHGRLTANNCSHRYHERKGHGDGFTPEEYESMWQEQEGKCAYCGQPMIRYRDIEGTLFQKTAPRSGGDYCNIEHIVPLSEGGLHELSNIVLACSKCNSEKGAETWNPIQEVLCGLN